MHRLLTRNRIPFVNTYTIAAGRSAVKSLLGRGGDITAVVCTADVLAVGALQECRALGVPVPAEVSVTGFDDRVELTASLIVRGSTGRPWG